MKRVNTKTGAGGRRGGRSAYQQEQRDRTRQSLLRGGAKVFAQKPYFEATIDDLAGTAGVSRAAFYIHFESKLDLALAVFKSGIGNLLDMFLALPSLDPDSPSEVRQWLDRLLSLYRKQVYISRLHAELDAFEPRFQVEVDRLNHELINEFANALPGFHAALENAENSVSVRIGTIMMINHVGTVCAMLAMRDKVEHESIYLDILSKKLNEFLNRYRSITARPNSQVTA